MERLDKSLSSPAPRLLYTRKEAAQLLSLAVTTLDVALSRGMLSSRKIGKKRLIPHASLVAFSQKSIGAIWPKKRNGKTVNTEKPVEDGRREAS